MLQSTKKLISSCFVLSYVFKIVRMFHTE